MNHTHRELVKSNGEYARSSEVNDMVNESHNKIQQVAEDAFEKASDALMRSSDFLEHTTFATIRSDLASVILDRSIRLLTSIRNA